MESYATDTNLSCKARGLLTFLIASPDGPASIGHLQDVLPEGRDAISAMLRELEAAGYIDRSRRRTDDARFTSGAVALTEKARA